MHTHTPKRGTTASLTFKRTAPTIAAFGLIVVTLLGATVASAEVMRAATGEPLFYPCTSCHPTAEGGGARADGSKLPNDFKEHKIVLAEHAVLGKGSAACEVCHEGADKDPGKLKTLEGPVDITGDVSKVCYQCHSLLYKEFEAGMHGHGEAKCTASGCHDPHAPGSMFAGALLPFMGSGFAFQVRPEKQPFTPMAAPGEQAPFENQGWLWGVFVVGWITVGGLAGSLVRGRSKE